MAPVAFPHERFCDLHRGWRRQVWLYAAALALLPVALFAGLSTFLSPPDPQFFWGFCVTRLVRGAGLRHLAVHLRLDAVGH
jgi:hypothetical protein